MAYVLVGVGSFIGANARFVGARLIDAAVETRFPLGSLVINVTGSLLLGILGTIISAKAIPNSEALRLALGVGFLSAFTTFSTFEFETNALLEDGSWLMATLNIVASVALGLVAVRVGILLARNWLT